MQLFAKLTPTGRKEKAAYSMMRMALSTQPSNHVRQAPKKIFLFFASKTASRPVQ
jgi:hypothetical protein